MPECNEMLLQTRKLRFSKFSKFFIITLTCLVMATLLTFNYKSLSGMLHQLCSPPPRKIEVIPDSNLPLIFIGGIPRSGTTLMRAILDAHPSVRCGQETRVIPKVLSLRKFWQSSADNVSRPGGVELTGNDVDAGIAAFVSSIIVNHGEQAQRYCSKDPFAFKYLEYLNKLFPKAKFLLMIRDGRATVHSIISRKVTISKFKIDSWADCLTKWNRHMESMYGQCLNVGRDKCMPIYYEQLVLHPERWIKQVVNFLDIPWTDNMLRHQDFIGKPGGVSISKVERSSDQIIKPINIQALSKWVGNIPNNVVQNMNKLAPMLLLLGYNPYENPPNYGTPDAMIINNTKNIMENKEFWIKRAQDFNIVRRTENNTARSR